MNILGDMVKTRAFKEIIENNDQFIIFGASHGGKRAKDVLERYNKDVLLTMMLINGISLLKGSWFSLRNACWQTKGFQ